MKKNLPGKVLVLAMVALVLVAAFGPKANKETIEKKCNESKSCQQNCIPETPKAAPEYIFYETLNGHMIVSNYKQ